MWRSTTVLLVLELSLLITPGRAQQLSVPLRFEPNAGQAAANVKYIAKGFGYTALLDEAGLTIRSAHPIRMRFAGALKPSILPVEEMNIHSNYYTGVLKIRLADATQTCLAKFDWSLAVHISGTDNSGCLWRRTPRATRSRQRDGSNIPTN